MSRRAVLFGAAAVAGAAGVGGRAEGISVLAPDAGQAQVPCWGGHQAGVETPPQAFARFLAFTLSPGVAAQDLDRLLRLWSDDIERLTQGRPALADPAPELAGIPARLTITVALGPGVFRLPELRDRRPPWLADLPHFPVDRLHPRWSGGDLLVQVAADDPMTVGHAAAVLVADTASFADLHWQQQGFQRAAGMQPGGTTGRNPMGQVDGTVNPRPGTADFAAVVWSQEGWWAGGTGLVLRRISMDLTTWAGVDRASQEAAIGRRLADGAPLTGDRESDAPDLDATDADGMLVIPEFAHIRRAAPQQPHEQILRRPYNYDDGSDAGLLFAAFAADPVRQFVPIQRRLAQMDLLNTWTTPVGSAVGLVLPGFEPGRWLGQGLLG